MNVFDFAMRLEEESQAYYEKLAAASRTKEMKTIFTLLADAEREHHEHLTMLKEGTDPALASSDVLERTKNFINKLVDGIPPEAVFRDDVDGYRYAIRQEEQSIHLYEKLADQEPNEGAANLLRRLADEERHHLEVVESIYDFVESPRTYLAWGEFSNLHDY